MGQSVISRACPDGYDGCCHAALLETVEEFAFVESETAVAKVNDYKK